jgi:hypothetical protein
MFVHTRSPGHSSWLRVRAFGARTLTSGRAYRTRELCSHVDRHRILLVPVARGLGGVYGMPVLPSACRSFSMLTRSATSERHGTPFRRYHSHHSHSALADTSVSLCWVFGGVQQAHVRFMARSGMVLRCRPCRSRRGNFAMNETPDTSVQRTRLRASLTSRTLRVSVSSRILHHADKKLLASRPQVNLAI